jgi:hypothetical protein
MEDINLGSSPSQREERVLESHFMASKGILDNDVLPFLLEMDGKAKRDEFFTTYWADKFKRDIPNREMNSGLFSSSEKIIAKTPQGPEVMIPENSTFMFERSVKLPTFGFKDKSKEKYMEVSIRDYNPVYFVFDKERLKQIELQRRLQFAGREFNQSAFDMESNFNQKEGIAITFDGYKWIYHKTVNSEGKSNISMSIWWFDESSGELKPLRRNLKLQNFSGENFDQFRKMIEKRAFYK